MTKVTRLLESMLTIVLVVYTYIYETSRCFVEKISKKFFYFSVRLWYSLYCHKPVLSLIAVCSNFLKSISFLSLGA